MSPSYTEARALRSLADLLAREVEPVTSIDEVDLDPLLGRIGGARAVLLGEATHGTSEFYRFRARITRELVERRGFRHLALEADWPDAARVDRYVLGVAAGAEEWRAFARFPTWMWRNLLDAYEPGARAVVWEHNSHLGDASATEMGRHGETNVGELCRRDLGDDVYSVGFGTDRGTVAAARTWDGPVETMDVRPALAESYEALCRESAVPAFLLPLRRAEDAVRAGLLEPRLERAIGVVYRPETERASHYLEAVLPEQFDEYDWFERTEAVHPLGAAEAEGMPETWPFGL